MRGSYVGCRSCVMSIQIFQCVNGAILTGFVVTEKLACISVRNKVYT